MDALPTLIKDIIGDTPLTVSLFFHFLFVTSADHFSYARSGHQH